MAEYLHKEELEYMNKCLEELPEDILDVVSMHYGVRGNRQHTLKEIGVKKERTHQRIQQISTGGVEKMRKIMTRRSPELVG